MITGSAAMSVDRNIRRTNYVRENNNELETRNVIEPR